LNFIDAKKTNSKTADAIVETAGRIFAAKGFARATVRDICRQAGGNIAASAAAKAPPDGYTLFFGAAGPLAVNPSLYEKLPFDPVKDFAPIGLVGLMPLLLTVPTSLDVHSLKDLIALAKAKPGQLNYASSGIGGTTHLAMERLKSQSGVNITHVPYKGNAPAYADLLAGQVQLMFGDVPSALPYVKAGRVRAFAITSQQRSPLMPDVPTVREAGLSGFESTILFGFIAPAGVPQDIIQRLNGEIVKILREPAFTQRFAAQAVDIVPTTPEGYGELIRRETAQWAQVIKSSGAKAD